MNHSEQIARWAAEELSNKYERGQRAHGGTINNKNVLADLTEELLDSVVYLAVIHEQFAVIKGIVDSVDYKGVEEGWLRAALRAIRNIVVTGNEGAREEEEREGSAEVKTFDEYYKPEIAKRIMFW